MTHSALFLTHAPHQAHLAFAKSIRARVVILPFATFVASMKQRPWLKPLYPLLTFGYALCIAAPEDVVVIDGGSSLFASLALKFRKPTRTLIYLDADLLFYDLAHKSRWKKKIWALLLQPITGIITVSELNKRYIFLSTPIYVCPPFSEPVPTSSTPKQNNVGLYVGRLDPEKRIDRTIAFALSCPTIERFYIVGDGVLRDYVSGLAKQHEKLMFVGSTNNVGQYYAQARFFIHLPDHDPHPVTTLEAEDYNCFPLLSPGCGTAYLFHERFILDDPDNFTVGHQKIHNMRDDTSGTLSLLQESKRKRLEKAASIRCFKTAFHAILSQSNV